MSETNKNYIPDEEIIKAVKAYETETVKNSGLEVNACNIEKSVYNRGNRALIAKVFKRAMSGGDITLVAFGGSITDGAAYYEEPKENIPHNYKEKKNYVNLVDCRLKAMFEPYGARVQTVNAGIGATNTTFGIHRMGEYVLAFNPDIVILEWDKNDSATDLSVQATYENMVRMLLKRDIAVIMLGMCGSSADPTKSSQCLHEPIADYYDVPYISYRDAFAGESYLEKLTNDTVHPNVVGHQLTALLINAYFGEVYKDISQINEEIPKIPEKPYNSEATRYGYGSFARLADIENGKISGIELISSGSFLKEEKPVKHGSRMLYAYTARYSDSYKPMVLKIKACHTLFFAIKRSYGISDGRFKIKINGREIENPTFNSSHSRAADNSQIENTYIWSSACAFYTKGSEDIVLEIYPTNANKNEYASIYGLFLTACPD